MYIIETKGLIFSGYNGDNAIIPRIHNIVLRIETRDGLTTLSLSDDEKILLQIPVTPEIRKILKKI